MPVCPSQSHYPSQTPQEEVGNIMLSQGSIQEEVVLSLATGNPYQPVPLLGAKPTKIDQSESTSKLQWDTTLASAKHLLPRA